MNQVLERPIIVEGKAYEDIPADLYIPPEYLEVFLDRFEGPLDLLLYLIRRRNFDILNLPIVKITQQYLQYLEIMRQKNYDIATEYLVMAATLIQLKSRLMLPRRSDDNDEEPIDPRAELAARLKAYEKTQQAAQLIDSYPRTERNFLPVTVDLQTHLVHQHYLCQPKELLDSYLHVVQRSHIRLEHSVETEQMTMREAMVLVLDKVQDNSCYFHDIVPSLQGIQSVVCCFAALLELAKQRLVRLTQNEPLADIFIQQIPPQGDAA